MDSWITIAFISLLAHLLMMASRWFSSTQEEEIAQPVPDEDSSTEAEVVVSDADAISEREVPTEDDAIEDDDRLLAYQLQTEWNAQDEIATGLAVVIDLSDLAPQLPTVDNLDEPAQQQEDDEDFDDDYDDGFDDYRVGNERDFGLKNMSAKAANDLKQFAGSQKKRNGAKACKDKKTKKRGQTKNLAIDNATRVLLDKLVDSGVLSAVHGVVCAGKESVVVQATGSSSNDLTIPAECALKIFKCTSKGKGRAHEHIENDGRYGKRYKRGASAAKNVGLWAEKEMQNLVRMRKANIPCPDVVMLKKHILVMSFLGEDGHPAPKLADVANQLTAEQVDMAYEDVVKSMHAMYNEAKLIHTDLSEFNLLYHQDRCYFIDVSQAVEPWDPQAAEFLLNDCTNVVRFFDRLGASNVMSPEELCDFISG